MGVNKDYWMLGEVTELADSAKISPQHMHDIICGRRNVSYSRAHLLVESSLRIGKLIPIGDWMDVKNSKHRAFKKGE